jgi:hypothetical protein
MSALFGQRDGRKGEEKHRVLQTFYIVIHMFQKEGWLLLHTKHKKSAKSDSPVREENQGTRKPREQQKTNEMCDCA